jgi:hypothetical protein
MRTAQARRIGRREAEELLSHGPVDPDRAALQHLLDQLAAPPSPRELAGRQAAMAAFAQAVRSPVPDPVGLARRRLRLLSRAALVKVVIGLGVLLFGSAALAAGTGNLPGPMQHGAHELFSPLGIPVPDVHGRPTGSGSAPAGSQPAGGASASPGDPGGGTGPVALGLCKAWAAAPQDGHGKPLDAETSKALIRAAGGADKIAAYCAKVLASGAPAQTADPEPLPNPQATQPGPPGGKPSHSPKGKGKPRPTPSHPH